MTNEQKQQTRDRIVDNAKLTTQEFDRIMEQAQASGTTPYDVIEAEIDKQISEL